MNIFFYCITILVLFFSFLNVSAQDEKKQDAISENAEPAEKQTPQKNLYFLNIVPPERSIQRRYEQAVRLIEAGRDAEAAQLLGSILESSADSFVAPLNKKEQDYAADVPQTTDRTFYDEVLEKLQGLSAKGKEAYYLQFETQAKRLLENAVKNNSFEEIQRVAKIYFPTSSGGLASFLVGMEQFRSGDYDAAARTFQRIETVKPRSADDLRQYEPLLSLSRLTCLLQTGKKDEARKVAEKFLRNFPEPEIVAAEGELWKPKTADEIIDKISDSIQKTPKIAIPQWLEHTGWLLPAGISAQNPETAADVPLLDFIWSVPALNLPSLSVSIEQLLRHVDAAAETYIPASQPLLIQDTLIVRGISEMTAVDAKTGKRLWYAEEQEPKIPAGVQIPYFSPFRMNLFRSGIFPQIPYRFILRMFFWHDRVANQMSSDGTKVFSVEGLDPMPNLSFGGNIRRQPIVIGGNKPVDDPRTRSGNTLTARDVKTGRILWQSGKFPFVQKVFDELQREQAAEEERKKQESAKKPHNNEQKIQTERQNNGKTDDIAAEYVFMSEVRFLGAPLPLQGKLYCIGERDSVVRLLVLDAQNGKLLSQLPLVQASVPIESETFRRYYGLIPSANGGIVYCPTGLRTLAAVDSVSLSPLWCFSYIKPVQEEEKRGNQFQNQFINTARNGDNPEFKRLFEKDGWQVPCLISDGSRLLFAPPDNTVLYCLDSSTGELLWKNEEFNRGNALFAACIRNDVCFIAAPKSVIPISMKTGKKLDEETEIKLPRNLSPAGTGIHNGSRYFLPLSGSLLGILDLDNRSVNLVSYQNPPANSEETKDNAVKNLPSQNSAPQNSVLQNEVPALLSQQDIAVRASSLVMNTSSANGTQLGNLIGLRGRFFSYSPSAVHGFDQWNVLKALSEKRLKDNPDDTEGLILSGRIKRAEGNIEKAAADFRRAYQLSKSSEQLSLQAADELRNTLLQAVRTDYNKWKSSAAELESLAEFPEELGEVLFCRAAGAFRDGDSASFIDVLKKVIRLELDHSVHIKTEPELISELHRILGLMMSRQQPASNAETFRKDLQRFSETFFQQLKDRKAPTEYLPNLELPDSVRQTTRVLLTRPWWEQNSLISSGEIHRWKLFADIFRSMPAAEKADAALQELYRQNQLFTALELSDNKRFFRILPEASPDKKVQVPYDKVHSAENDETIKKNNAKNILPPPSLRYKPKTAQEEKYNDETVHWDTANPVFSDSTDITETADKQNQRQGAAQRILAQLNSRSRNTGNQASVPYLGSYDRFISPYSYSMEVSFRNTPALICTNQSGEEQWRLDLSDVMPDVIDYGFFSDNSSHYKQGFNQQQVYLKGCNHLLVLVQGNTVLAIDTYSADFGTSPTILWTKRTAMPQTAKEMFTARPLNNLTNWFPDSSVFVSGKVVCYCETDKVFGLDPMTGRMLWCRELTQPVCSLLGDGEHLFIYYPQSHSAVALSPETGHILAAGKIPAAVLFAYETNLILLKDEWKQQRRFQVNTADLRDMLSQQTDDSKSENIAETAAIPVYSVWADVSEHSQICTVLDGQVLALLSWDNKVVHLFDILNQRDLLGLLDSNGRRTGAKMPVSQLKRIESWDCDLDVQIVDGKYLVMFTDKRQVDTSQKPLTENGVIFRRHCNVVPNTSCKSTGSATIMLFESDGTECWKKPVRINDWFTLQRTPSASPLMLFAMSITDQENNKPPHFLTGLMGIDKVTGKISFRKLIPSQQGNDNSALRGFQVSLSQKKKEISFVAANRTVSAAFEQPQKTPENNTPQSETPKPKNSKPEAQKPAWGNIIDSFLPR